MEIIKINFKIYEYNEVEYEISEEIEYDTRKNLKELIDEIKSRGEIISKYGNELEFILEEEEKFGNSSKFVSIVENDDEIIWNVKYEDIRIKDYLKQGELNFVHREGFGDIPGFLEIVDEISKQFLYFENLFEYLEKIFSENGLKIMLLHHLLKKSIPTYKIFQYRRKKGITHRQITRAILKNEEINLRELKSKLKMDMKDSEFRTVLKFLGYKYDSAKKRWIRPF